MLFSLKNLQDATLGFRERSKLEKIFHRKSPALAEPNVCGVWSVYGHTFVASNDGCDLLALDSLPRSKFVESDGLLVRGRILVSFFSRLKRQQYLQCMYLASQIPLSTQSSV